MRERSSAEPDSAWFCAGAEQPPVPGELRGDKEESPGRAMEGAGEKPWFLRPRAAGRGGGCPGNAGQKAGEGLGGGAGAGGTHSFPAHIC